MLGVRLKGVRSQKSEVRSQKSGVRSQKSGVQNYLLPFACCLLPLLQTLLSCELCSRPFRRAASSRSRPFRRAASLRFCLLPLAFCLLPFASCLLPLACLLSHSNTEGIFNSLRANFTVVSHTSPVDDVILKVKSEFTFRGCHQL